MGKPAPYTIATATDAQLSIIVGAFKTRPIETDTILKAEVALEAAVHERVLGRTCKADVQPMEGRWIRLVVSDVTEGIEPEDRQASFDREFEV